MLNNMRWWERITADSLIAEKPQQRHPQEQTQSSSTPSGIRKLSAVVRAVLLSKRRLRLEPEKKLVFRYEPGKQVSSAVKIRNSTNHHVAYKFQTNAPKSCFMRPPNGIIRPKETIYATVFRFVEYPGRMQQMKIKEKFKILSRKVSEGTDYTPELFEEEKELVTVEQILPVVFIDPKHSSSVELERLEKLLYEAEAAQKARKKLQEGKMMKGIIFDGLVIDEWKERREKYLAKIASESSTQSSKFFTSSG
ncbi:hypothetical protein O6H91_18G056900 [Diphasiastrum complanatum]|uniref:Uncharacterized protein n=1 Tax=Diphasiastrum complanatum TaxID=34168 RepID=A0ACC2B1K9_DIPCM|nr:hypothetical protein O6H91_18G056900 [Diphasiastrum complanatum]